MNLRQSGKNYSSHDLLRINEDIFLINKYLRQVSSKVHGLYTVDHPQFETNSGFINDSLLAADGLHLSFEGTRTVVSNIESAILEVRNDLSADKISHSDVLSHEVMVDLDEDTLQSDCLATSLEIRRNISPQKLSYADVLRYGEAKPKTEVKVNLTEENIPRGYSSKSPSIDQSLSRKKRYHSNRHSGEQRSVKKRSLRHSGKVSQNRTTVSVLPQKKNRSTNRYSILATDFESSDRETEEEIDTKESVFHHYHRMTGGCVRSNQENEKVNVPSEASSSTSSSIVSATEETSEEDSSTMNLESATETVTVQIFTSEEDPDEASCDRTVNSTETSVLDTNPYKHLSEEEHEEQLSHMSMDSDLRDLEIPTRDLKPEEEKYEENMDSSVIEVIQLLNDKDTNNPANLETNSKCEEDNSAEKKVVQLVEGQTFSSYEEFKNEFDTWCDQNNHPMKTDSSVKNDEESLSFPYRQIRFACKHAGKPRIRGEGKRPVQAYLACECPVVLRLKIDPKVEKYKITKLIDAHNHTTSKGEFKHYTAIRKLNDTQRDDIKALIDLQVETKKYQNIYS